MNVKIDPLGEYRKPRMNKWWILRELHGRAINSTRDWVIEEFTLHEQAGPGIPTVEEQRSILKQMAGSKTITLERIGDKDTYRIGLTDQFIKTYNDYTVRMKEIAEIDALPSTIKELDVNMLKVVPSNYDKASRVINLLGISYSISLQARRRDDTKEAKLMGLLFSVKYFYDGLPVKHIYPNTPVANPAYEQKRQKKARLLVAAINSKLPAELKGRELIKFNKLKFYIDPQYLKK